MEEKPIELLHRGQVGFPLFFCDFRSKNAEIAPFSVHFVEEMKETPTQSTRDVKRQKPEEVSAWQKKNQIKVRGKDVPKPVRFLALFSAPF